MGFLDMFKQSSTPQIQTALPETVIQEYRKGNLPILNASKIFLQKGEKCHYFDKAIYEKKVVKKRTARRNNGYSMPGFFKGTRVYSGGGISDTVENVSYDSIKGILYITNKRIIFVDDEMGFDKKTDDIIALTPYANCVEIQFKNGTYKIFVPDGNIVNFVLRETRK